ncbi:hypothetical protein ABVT39_004772 [Epinephelus coioides]
MHKLNLTALSLELHLTQAEGQLKIRRINTSLDKRHRVYAEANGSRSLRPCPHPATEGFRRRGTGRLLSHYHV